MIFLSPQTRRLYVNLITLLVISGGLYNFFTINRESYPSVIHHLLTVTAVFPNASTQEIETKIIRPIEEKLESVEGIETFRSTAVRNLGTVEIEFEEASEDKVRKRIDKVRRELDGVELPLEMENRLRYWEWDISSFPILSLGFSSESLPYKELRKQVLELKDYLLKLSEVTAIDEVGLKVPLYRIDLKPDLLKGYGLSVGAVLDQLKQYHIDVTAGEVIQKDREHTVTMTSRISDASELSNISFLAPSGRVAISKVASIHAGFSKEFSHYRVDGEPAVQLQVKKRKDKDVIRTIEKIKDAVDEFQRKEKKHLAVKYTHDSSELTQLRMNVTVNNAYLGIFLVILILLIFMEFRPAVWSAFGIIFSIAFAILLFRFFGITINAISLLAIIVVLGIVVDDSIVVSENIYRHRLYGKGWMEASREGLREVALPVLASITTTIVAFLPIYHVAGTPGKWSREIPIVVALALMGSAVESLLMLPTHMTRKFFFFKQPVVEKKKEKAIIAFLIRHYTRLLRFFLRYYRLTIFFCLLAMGLSIYYLFFHLKFINFPDNDTTRIDISGRTVAVETLDVTAEAIYPLEDIVKTYLGEGVISYIAQIGELGFPQKFKFSINLTAPSQRDMHSEEIVDRLRSHIEADTRLTNVVISKELAGIPEERGVILKVVGNENVMRKQVVDKVIEYLQTVDGVKNIDRNDMDYKANLRLRIDIQKANQEGVSVASIPEVLRTTFHGFKVFSIRDQGEQVDTHVGIEESEKNQTKNILSQIEIIDGRGQLRPISRYLDVSEEREMGVLITHHNGKRCTVVEADLDMHTITPKEMHDNIIDHFPNFEETYSNFSLVIGGEAGENKETYESIFFVGLFSLIGILTVLFILFRSVGQALLILLAIPCSLVGIALALMIHGMGLSYSALLGILGLSGVVVNNSLVLVNYINILKKRHTNQRVFDLIIEGASTRLRPILTTSLTTVFGLMPTAYGLGGKDIIIMPMVIVISWGLFFSAALVLILVPCFYMAEYNLYHLFRKKKSQE